MIDTESPVWVQVAKHLSERLAALRQRAEALDTDDRTSLITRAQIEECKRLLALPETVAREERDRLVAHDPPIEFQS